MSRILSLFDTLKKYNEIFVCNFSHGDETQSDIFKFDNKESNLILSAPHATRSFVNKAEKSADLYTGALVKFIGEKTQTSTLIRTKFTPYKALISDYIVQNNLQNHYFLDIHGFNQNLDCDICLGIGNFDIIDYPYLQNILHFTNKYNLKVLINHPHYTGIKGLTGRYHKLFGKPNVIQIELQYYLRDFFQYPDNIQNITIPFFSDVISCYK